MKPSTPDVNSKGAPSRIPVAPPASPSSPVVKQDGAAKRWVLGLVVALVCAAGMWGWGFFQGRAALAPQRTLYEQRLSQNEVRLGVSESQLKRVQDDLAQSRYRAQLLEARSLLLRAAIDLEKRNFGTANTRLRAAADELKNLPVSDSVNSALSALQREMSSTNLVVATDVEKQRARVLEFGERLDSLTPLASLGTL